MSPQSYDFGIVVIGQTKTFTFGVANNGNTTLTVNSITSNNPRFSVGGPPSISFAPGFIAQFPVSFNPTAIGFQTGQLTFNSNDPDQPTVTVSLSGTGISAVDPANLICNPGAELGAGSATGNDIVSIPGWINESGFTVAQYGAAGFPTVGESQRIGGGGNFFSGGPNNARSSAYQVIDISARAADIDAGRLTAILRGQLGGFADERDSATLWAFYRDANNGEMGGLSIGPTQGTNNTFSLQVNTFRVPPGARFIRMEMIAVRASGSDNNAYFDNLYLGLAGGTEPPGGGGRCSPDTAVTNCLPSFPGLIGWWPGDGNANDLVGGNHGTASGNANFAAGKVAQAFNFGGTGSSVFIPDAPALRPAKLSIEAWVRFNSLDAPGTTTPGLQYLVCKPTQDSVGSFFSSYALGKWRSGGRDRFTLNLTSADSSVLLESTQRVVAGQFYHVVGTYDGSVAKLFVNGVLDDSVPISLSLDYDSHPLYFGNAGLTEGWFQGQLDEVSIYNRALSDSEITALYVVGGVGKCKTGAYPTIDVSPLSLDFANVIVGETKDRSLTLRNVGTGPLTVNSIGSDNPAFIVISPLGSFGIATGAQQVVTVRFAPTRTNSQTATLAIRSDDANRGIVNVLCSGNGTSTNCPVVPAGIVGWWPGQGNATDIIGGNNGTVSSGVTFTSGKVGQAFQFAGTPSSVSIPDAPELRPAQVTVEAWVRFDALNVADIGVSYFVAKTWNRGFGNAFASYALAKYTSGGKATDAQYNIGLPLVATLVAGQYYHVAGTYDGSTAKLYVNGALNFSGNVSLKINYDATALRFGYSGQTNERSFQGQLDEVSIYNRVLSATEIASIYFAGAAGKCGGNASLIVPLSGFVPQPLPTGSQLTISWPDSPATLYLQYTTDFINWFNVTNPTRDANGANTVTEPITGKLKFYRLVR
ncbi:MAG: hypothetical protein DME26_04120 [Verrucomicrobia bacterium]|nr:MAG: hypothetical protein DME26_04120 [Verrucomicrobiota bacterium]